MQPGYGARIGYQGELTPALALGAAYQTKIRMGRFHDYAGLFADRGSFDIPASASVGIAWKPSPAVTLAVDVQQIYYSKIKSVGDPLFPISWRLPSALPTGRGSARVLSHSVKGPNPLEAPGAQQIELEMDQWDVQLGYSWGF